VALLVLGLGNPGSTYARTRHNVGAEAVEVLAGRLGLSLRPERRLFARLAEGVVGERRVALAIPSTYMNDSGIAARALVRRCSIEDAGRLLVVHDDLDLPVGVVRIKRGGGTGGHNGLRSIEAHLGSLDFLRIRIGIGRPPGKMAGATYVLRRPSPAQAEELALAVQVAADAALAVLHDGVDKAMNEFNRR
jgi:PTH1 family peptidyl-tRNA hydrolase